jgi:hypothetical protein
MTDSSQLSVEVSFETEAAANYIEGYLAGIDGSLAGDPSEHVTVDEQFFREHLRQFVEIEPVGGYGQ